MVEFLAGNRIRGKSTERLVTGLAHATGGWVELGRHTIGTATATMDVSGLANKQYYQVLIDYRPSSTISATDFRFNADSGTNYSQRSANNGGAQSSSGSLDGVDIYQADYPHFGVFHVASKSTEEKLVTGYFINQGAAGVTNEPSRQDQYMKWANTTDVIDQISLIASSNTWVSGAEMVVLGYDPTDTHTTNFWEELSSVTLDIAGNLSSGTITAKKYLWVQMYVTTGTSANDLLRFNGDAGTTYTDRYSQDGAADVTRVSGTSILNMVTDGGDTTPAFVNMFIINNSANEKLIMGYVVQQGTAGSGTSPNRTEFVGNWINTTEQITDVTLEGTLGIGSIIKVWGSN